MLIEQIIEFELKGHVPLGHICTSYVQLVIFIAKQKFLTKIFGVDYYFLLKHCARPCTLHFSI